MLSSEQQNLETIFLDFAQRIKDPIAVKQFMSDPLKVYGAGTASYASWKDLSLGTGYPGILLLCTLLEKLGLCSEGIAHRYVLEIKTVLENHGINSYSLYSGLTGLCYAIEMASFEKTRYQSFLQTLQSLLLNKVEEAYLIPLSNNIKQKIPSSPSLYDPISGVCGIGRYALENLSIPSFHKLSEKITNILIQFSLPILVKSHLVPGWYLPASDHLNEVKFKKNHPNGNFNLGLAHGVTGILAFLSTAYLKGIRMEGHREAIERLATWIRSKSFSYQGGTCWPYAISWEEEVEGKPIEPKLIKAGWCYGVPGIARTLFLAGKALKDIELKEFATRSMVELLSKPAKEWRLPGPGLCHGIAGLLAITQAMSDENEGKELQPKVLELKEMLINQYDPETPWGFADLDFVSTPDHGYHLTKMNKVGLLEGATGVLLTLLSPYEKTFNWQLPLMIYE